MNYKVSKFLLNFYSTEIKLTLYLTNFNVKRFQLLSGSSPLIYFPPFTTANSPHAPNITSGVRVKP